MRTLLIALLLCFFGGRAVLADDSVKRVSYFADPYGNTGSFWVAEYRGQTYKILKIKSSDHAGDADFPFDEATLAEFEAKVAEMRRTPNNLKTDGFQVLWSRHFGDATVRTLLGRLNGTKVKMVQVEQNKANQPKSEHQICMDPCYSDFSSALQKAKKAHP